MNIKELEKQREQELERIFAEAMAQMENLKTCITIASIAAFNNREYDKLDKMPEKHYEVMEEIISNLIKQLDEHFDDTDYITKIKYNLIAEQLKAFVRDNNPNNK